MKKILFIIFVTIISLSILGCGNDTQKEQETKSTQTEKIEAICPTAGIGDNISLFDANYGEPKGDQPKIYSNGNMLVFDADDLATSITIYDEQGRVFNLEQMADFIPTDTKVIEQYEDTTADFPTQIIICESQKLSQALPVAAKDGKFTITQHVNVTERGGDGKTVIIIGLGDKP